MFSEFLRTVTILGNQRPMKTQGDYHRILVEELNRRSRRNPAYSLRAFARDLQLSPSRLSEILSGKKGLSGSAARSICRLMALPGDQAQLFCESVESLHARSAIKRNSAQAKLKLIKEREEYSEIALDQFQLIAEWHHFAVFEALSVPGFKGDPQRIAQALGISKLEATSALERLKRLNLAEKTPKGWRAKQATITTPDVPSKAIRSYHRALIQKAEAALETQTIHERDFSSVTMAIDPDLLPEAKQWIQSFRRKFCKKISSTGRKRKVYCLAVQFFDLTTGPIVTGEEV